jgi:cell division protein FtsB
MLLLGVAVLLLLALAGDRGRFAILKLEAARSGLLSEIRTLEVENRELELAVEQLRRPGLAAEKTARETFGLLRPDELMFVDSLGASAPPKDERREPNGPPPR